MDLDEVIFTVALKHVAKAYGEGKPRVAEKLVDVAVKMLEATGDLDG